MKRGVSILRALWIDSWWLEHVSKYGPLGTGKSSYDYLRAGGTHYYDRAVLQLFFNAGGDSTSFATNKEEGTNG